MAAKASPTSKFSINLNILFPQGIPEKLPVRFLKWMIAYGRFIAIIIEIIVMTTFIASFKFDQDLKDTNDQINQKVPFIKNLSNDEQLIRQTQFKLATIKATYTNSPDWTALLSKLSAEIPTDVKFDSINFTHTPNSPGSSFRLTGSTSYSIELDAFLSFLKKDPSFKNIALASIGYDAGIINFAITGEVK